MLEQLLAETQPSGESVLEQPFPEGLHPREGTYPREVCEELQPMGRSQVGEVPEGLSPMGEIHAGEVEVCESFSEEKNAADRACNEPTDHNPHSLSPCTSAGRMQRKFEMKLRDWLKGLDYISNYQW